MPISNTLFSTTLICAVSTEGERDKTGFEAITLLFDKVVGIGGEINVYRMTADLAMCAHALVLGKKLQQVDEATVRQRVEAVLGRDAETPVLVKADERVPYGRVVQGMVILQQAGAKKIGHASSSPPATARWRRGMGSSQPA